MRQAKVRKCCPVSVEAVVGAVSHVVDVGPVERLKRLVEPRVEAEDAVARTSSLLLLLNRSPSSVTIADDHDGL
jgi:hypothetical protein